MKLTAIITSAMAVAMLSGTSAFAEMRHRDETRVDRSTQQSEQSRSGSNDQSYWRDRTRSDSTQRNENRAYDQNRSNQNTRSYNNNRSYDTSRANSTRSLDTNRSNSNRSFDTNRSYDNRSYGRSQTYRNEGRASESFHGRVNRVEHFGGGYRVWVGGARYPFFISGDRWSRFPIRVGLAINLGGYWNPAGYYDVYDVGPYATAGDLHGVVESVDYRRGTAVLRDDISGSFVTIVLRGNDPRLGGLRPGDYVELTGAWNRAGVFDAYNVADIRGGGYGRYDDGRQY